VTLTITVTPSTGLDRYGATVHVTGSGFPAGATVYVRQCNAYRCDQSTYPVADARGNFASDPVVTFPMSSGT